MKKQLKIFLAMILVLTVLLSAVSCKLFGKGKDTEASGGSTETPTTNTVENTEPQGNATTEPFGTPTTEPSTGNATEPVVTNQGVGEVIPWTDGTSADN